MGCTRAYRGIGAALLAAHFAMLLGACASLPAPAPRSGPDSPAMLDLGSRVRAVLERRALGPDALGVIDNLVRHGGSAPAFAPASVRGILERPLAAADAQGLFDDLVPKGVVDLVQAIEARGEPQAGTPISARDFLAPHLEALAAAQRELRASLRAAPPLPAALIEQLKTDLPRRQIAALLQAADAVRVGQAADLFLASLAVLARQLRAMQSRLQWPDALARFDSAIGPVVIGTPGDDRHAAGAALILDPGGDDIYERAPLAAGALAVVLDLAGNDRYEGDDLAVLALSALIDFAGDDRYDAAGPAQAAAFGGLSILVDAAGNDHYRAGGFAQGAAALGFGVLTDLAGHDRYEIFSGGQGFGMTSGIGLLWDRAGHDAYLATGFRDLFERGGGVSFAQGAGLGLRASVGGGVGILRDDGGDDHYRAEMFAQGGSYYYAAGLLWDRAGDDRYDAVRYAQGSGTHEAAGMLRDEAGDDRYRLEFGVGQGMGLDVSVGLLLDLAGEDEFRAPRVAQGSATANGIGILAAFGRRNRFATGDDPRGWGHAQWERSLPSIGLLLYDEAGASFERAGKPMAPPAGHAALGGPDGGKPVEHLPVHQPTCPAAAAAPGDDRTPLAAQLAAFLPGIVMSRGEGPLFADIRRRIAADPAAALAQLPRGDFSAGYALGEALRCMLASADASGRAALWDAMERHLLAQPNPAFVPQLLTALRPHPAPEAQMRRMLAPLAAHPSCGVRAAAIELGGSAAAAQAALRDACWRVKAEAVALLDRLGVAPDPAAPLPGFLAQRIRLFSSGPGTSPSR